MGLFWELSLLRILQTLTYGMGNEPDRIYQARTPVLPDLRLFAIETIETIIEIIQTCDDSTASFCATLRGVLWSIKTELQKHHQDYDGAESRKVKSLLNNLERLCSVCLCSTLFCYICLVPKDWGKDLSMEFMTHHYLWRMPSYPCTVRVFLLLTYIPSGPDQL